MTSEFNDFWVKASNKLAKFFGVVPHVLQDGEHSHAFFLGNFQAYRVIQKQRYIFISYLDWEKEGFEPKEQTDHSSKSLANAVESFTPLVLQNLEINKNAIKILKAI